MKKILILLLVLCFALVSKADQLEDFYRGSWISFAAINDYEFACAPGMRHYDVSEIDWDNERRLLQELHMNLIESHLQWEHVWMDSICLWSNGAIKMFIGFDTQDFASNFNGNTGERWDSLNITFWSEATPWPPDPEHQWVRPQYYPDEEWKEGIQEAIDYWDTLYGDDSGVNDSLAVLIDW